MKNVKVNELRNNNYVIKNNELQIVFNIYGSSGLVDIKDVESNYPTFRCSPILAPLEPIILTEEWLLKFGFWKSKHGWFEKIPFIRFTVEFLEPAGNGACILSGLDEKDDANLICIIDTVHKFQNWWFFTTGEELI